MKPTSTAPVKKVYITHMCDHAYVLAAALRAYGTPSEVLPPNDDETTNIGKDLCIGRECLPCFTTTGDYIRLAQRPDFDPAKSKLLIATCTGACRFGQYINLQRHILDEHGLSELEFLAPSADDSYQDLGEYATETRYLIWQGIIAADLLQKLLHEHRPYEIQPGQTDQVYQRCLNHIVNAIELGGGKYLIRAMEWVARQFEDLPVDRSTPRPVIGMVGEIYLRFNTYSNMEIIRRVEAAGGEVHLATMAEWIYYTNWEYIRISRLGGMYLELAKTYMTDMVQRRQEYRIAKPVAHLLKEVYEPPTARLMKAIEPYYHAALNTEALLSIGRAVDLADHGVSGIINVMPFSCMPGIITAAIAPRIRANHENIPWLDISYDTQGGTNINTRLEAFMYQVTQFDRRTQAGQTVNQ